MLLILIFGFSFGFVNAQSRQNPKLNKIEPDLNPPGNIKLLSGYTHLRKMGTDSRVGEISKPDGLTLRYDIGRMAGNYTEDCQSPGQCFWFKSQKLNDQEIFIAMTKDGKLVVHFPSNKANFFAVTKSMEEIADFFLMVLTYQPKKESSE